MKVYKDNIEKSTLKNKDFRKVVFTGPNSQLVLMSLKPGEEIGKEIHEEDQFFRFEEGNGKVVVGRSEFRVKDGDAVVVPAGTNHNIINTSRSKDLKLYTIYSPSHHPDKTIHKDKAAALAAEADE
jgi:mannose-6-phosphate isomerase-like protein (cupin superfamily)